MPLGITNSRLIGRFSFPHLDNGSSAHVYVLDTGITPTHEDFGDRAEAAYNAIDDGRTVSTKIRRGNRGGGGVDFIKNLM